MNKDVWPEFFHLSKQLPQFIRRFLFQFFHFFEIFLLRIRPVVHIVLLAVQTNAGKAVFERCAVIAGKTIFAVFAILKKSRIAAAPAIQTFIAILTIAAVGAINAVFIVISPVVVMGILQKIASDGKIRINALKREIPVLGIFAGDVHEREPRDVRSQRIEGIEKGHTGLPDVFPETFLAIHDIFAVGRVGGNDVLLTFVALALVELAFVPKGKPPFLAAFRTIRGPRQIFFQIKFLFLGDNEELLLA